MGSFGENLRREREMRGVTLKEISDSTKISIRFLECLEGEEFSKLPGGIFTRSFIRCYANYLGLDAEQVLAEYQLVFPPKDDEDFSRIGVNHSIGRSPSGRRTLVAWLVAVILLAGGYALFRYSHQHTDAFANLGSLPQTAKAAPLNAAPGTSAASPIANSATAPPGMNPAAVGATSQGSGASGSATSAAPLSRPSAMSGAAQGESPSSTSNVTPGRTAAGTEAAAGEFHPPVTETSAAPGGTAAEPSKILGQGNMMLQIAATERSWVAVECDGKTLLQRILNPNEVRTLRASDYFNITTGNAQGIILTLNGQTMKPLGRFGEVKTIRLTLADLKRPTPNP
ncbi:MAG: RodZ domain-containing protein [Terriglobia bacterium]